MCGVSYVSEINEVSLYNSYWHSVCVQYKQNCANKSQTTQPKYVHLCVCLRVSDDLKLCLLQLVYGITYVVILEMQLVLYYFKYIMGLQLTIIFYSQLVLNNDLLF